MLCDSRPSKKPSMNLLDPRAAGIRPCTYADEEGAMTEAFAGAWQPRPWKYATACSGRPSGGRVHNPARSNDLYRDAAPANPGTSVFKR